MAVNLRNAEDQEEDVSTTSLFVFYGPFETIGINAFLTNVIPTH